MKQFRPYQKEMIDFALSNKRCNLFAGMGLGKTSVMLMVLSILKDFEPESLPALVVAPKRVATSVWSQEIAEWPQIDNLTASVVVGTPAQRMAALRPGFDVYVTNYDNLQWLEKEVADWPWRTVICDESTRAKGLRAAMKRAKNGKIYPAIGGTQRARVLAKAAYSKTRRWINLSGTPAPNGYLDLYGPQWLIDYGSRLGRSYTAFKERWFDECPYTQRVTLKDDWAGEQIIAAMRDCTLSLKSEDYFDLTAPIETVVPVTLPPEARKKYDEMEREWYTEIEGFEMEAQSAATRSAKLVQFAAGAVYTEDGGWADVHDVKIDALQEIIEEAAGAPVLVAYHFKSDKARILKAFPQARWLDSDPKTIDDWNAGRIPILVANPQSAGHGLNLALGGNILVFFSVWWDLELHEQIIERLGPVRQMQAGLARNVFLYYILSQDTIDEDILVRLRSKSSLQDALRNALRRIKH